MTFVQRTAADLKQHLTHVYTLRPERAMKQVECVSLVGGGQRWVLKRKSSLANFRETDAVSVAGCRDLKSHWQSGGRESTWDSDRRQAQYVDRTCIPQDDQLVRS